MFEYLKTWTQLKTDRRGVTMLEYAIMGALVAVVAVVGATALGGAVNTQFTNIGTKVTNPSTP